MAVRFSSSSSFRLDRYYLLRCSSSCPLRRGGIVDPCCRVAGKTMGDRPSGLRSTEKGTSCPDRSRRPCHEWQNIGRRRPNQTVQNETKRSNMNCFSISKLLSVAILAGLAALRIRIPNDIHVHTTTQYPDHRTKYLTSTRESQSEIARTPSDT